MVELLNRIKETHSFLTSQSLNKDLFQHNTKNLSVLAYQS